MSTCMHPTLHAALSTFAAQLSAETVGEQRNAIRESEATVARLANRLNRVRAVLLEEILYDIENLVVEVDGKPTTLFALYEDARHQDLARAILAILDGGAWPRRLCTVCRDIDCTGHGESEDEQTLPFRVRELLKEMAL